MNNHRKVFRDAVPDHYGRHRKTCPGLLFASTGAREMGALLGIIFAGAFIETHYSNWGPIFKKIESVFVAIFAGREWHYIPARVWNELAQINQANA